MTVVVLLASCDDTTDTLGSTLIGTDDRINTEGASYDVFSRSVRLTKVNSRSSFGYIGKMKDSETNAYVTCNFMTQFRPMGDSQFYDLDQIPLNDSGKLEADSCTLLIYYPTYYGDALARISTVCHELKTPYSENEVYYIDAADFNPQNMIATHKGSVHTALSFTPKNQLHGETQTSGANYVPYFSFNLNGKYCDKDGVEYKNYGTYLLQKFADPATRPCFSNIYDFNNKICPGFYIETTNGLGSIVKITVTQMFVYFHNKNGERGYTSFAGTQEVLQRTTIERDEEELAKMIADQTCTYLKSPASIYTEVTLPVEKILEGHESDTLNVAKLTLPCLATANSNLSKPSNLLLLPVYQLQEFFDQKKTPDSKTQFTAAYSAAANNYTFTNIASLISYYRPWKKELERLDAVYKQTGSAEDKKKLDEHAAKNPTIVAVVPIEATYTTMSSGSSMLTKVTYDMSMTTAKLAKGTLQNSPVQLSVIYSNYNFMK